MIQEPDIYVDSILAALEYHEATEVTQDPIKVIFLTIQILFVTHMKKKIAEILSEKLKGIEADIPEVPDLNNVILVFGCQKATIDTQIFNRELFL